MNLIKDRRGGMTILFLGIVFVLLSLTFLILELGSTYERYDYAMDVLQRACNSAVERNIRDEYRADKILLLDCDGAETDFRSYARLDLPDRYRLEIESVSCTDSPPGMTAIGKITFSTMFSQYGFRDVTYSFKVRATNYDLDP